MIKSLSYILSSFNDNFKHIENDFKYLLNGNNNDKQIQDRINEHLSLMLFKLKKDKEINEKVLQKINTDKLITEEKSSRIIKKMTELKHMTIDQMKKDVQYIED